MKGTPRAKIFIKSHDLGPKKFHDAPLSFSNFFLMVVKNEFEFSHADFLLAVHTNVLFNSQHLISAWALAKVTGCTVWLKEISEIYHLVFIEIYDPVIMRVVM